MKILNVVFSLFLNDRTDGKCANHNCIVETGGNANRPPLSPSLWNPSETETVTITIKPQETVYFESLFLQDDPARGGIQGVKATQNSKTWHLAVPIQNAGPKSLPFAKTSVKSAYANSIDADELAEFRAYKAMKAAG